MIDLSALKSTYIIAELSANHNQDFDLTLKTIDAIKASGADAVKIQTFKPESMTLDLDHEIFRTRKDSLWAGQKLFDLFKKGAMPYEWQPKIKDYAQKLGLDFFSTPFDFEAVDFLEKMEVPAYKIASLEITDLPLIEYVAKKGKPVILSTGIASLADIELAVNTCRKAGNDQIALLKCTSAYPAPMDQVNLNNLISLQKLFNVTVGISDHTLSHVVPIAAVALGAKIIEKHFILDKSLDSLDQAFSLSPREFKQMVSAVRDTEKALGTPHYQVTEKMEKARISARSLYAVAHIQAGELFSAKNVKALRPGYGLHPRYYSRIIGKPAPEAIKKGTPLNFKIAGLE
ncbi:MAG: pseudaminic acid synthase [Candidatus Cyclobacteriaceae bacterium M3_2C_046]